MHPSAYGRRNEIAQNRLVAAGRVLAQALGLDGNLVEAVARVQGSDPQIKALIQRERLADLLEAAATQAPEILAKLDALSAEITALQSAPEPEPEAKVKK